MIAPCERPQHLQTAAAVRAALGEEGFAAARQQGLTASMDELTADLPSARTPSRRTHPVRPKRRTHRLRRNRWTHRSRPPRPSQPRPSHRAEPAPAEPAPPSQPRPSSPAGSPAQSRARPRLHRPGRGLHRPCARGGAGAGQPPQRRAAAAATGPLRVRTLGAAAVEFGEAALTAADWGYAKPRELMFLLVSSPPLTKDQIAAALWPDLSRQQLGNALHTALRELRRALGDPGWVVYADGRYRFDRSRPHECDVTTFEDALAAARRARPAQAALPDLQRAVAAYGGDFLDGMSAGEWALVRRDELRRAFESALLATGRLQAAAGRHQAAASAFRRAVAHEPLNESAHRELMSSWARLGETARAIRHYEELTELLREQVGVPPAAETTALYRKLSTGS